VFAHAGDGGLYVGPGAMHRAAYGAPLRGLTAETANLGFKLCRALGATPRRCLEQRLEIRAPNPFGSRAEALFSIAAYFEQIVQRRDHVMIVHGQFPFPSHLRRFAPGDSFRGQVQPVEGRIGREPQAAFDAVHAKHSGASRLDHCLFSQSSTSLRAASLVMPARS
jgi:hypothetical protein